MLEVRMYCMGSTLIFVAAKEGLTCQWKNIKQDKCQIFTLKQFITRSHGVFWCKVLFLFFLIVMPCSIPAFHGWRIFSDLPLLFFFFFFIIQFQPMVFQKHHERFAAWHNSWLQENVSPRAADLVQDWLTGEDDEEMVPCKTMCEISEVHGMTVTRYRVQYTRRASSPWHLFTAPLYAFAAWPTFLWGFFVLLFLNGCLTDSRNSFYQCHYLC